MSYFWTGQTHCDSLIRMTSRFPEGTSFDPELDPILAAIARAPVGEPFTDEQRAELDQAMADITSGKVKLIPHEEVHAWLQARIAEEAEVAAE